MTVLSTPIKNDIAMQKDIFRFSATLFSETTDAYSSLDSQLQMIKCVFAKADNQPFSKEELVIQLQNVYKYHITVEEISAILLKQKKTFQTLTVDGEESYGAAEFWYYTETNEIHTARIGYRTDIDQDTRNSVLLEEIINVLGISDSELRTDSIVYQYGSEVTALSDMDWLILKLMYNKRIRCGMDAAQCEEIIRELYY